MDRQHVEMPGDARAQKVETEVTRPQAARHLRLQSGRMLANLLRADLAEAQIVLDRRRRLVALHDLIQPLEAPDAALVVLREIRGRCTPAVVVERIRFEARRIDALGHDPFRRSRQQDVRTHPRRVDRVDVLVESVQTPLASRGLESGPAREQTAEAEAHAARGLDCILAVEVRAAERRTLAAERLDDVGHRAEIAGAGLFTRRHEREEDTAEALLRNRDRVVLHRDVALIDDFALRRDELQADRLRQRAEDLEFRLFAVEEESARRIRLHAEDVDLGQHEHTAATGLPREVLAVRSDELGHEANLARHRDAARGESEFLDAVADGDRIASLRPETGDTDVMTAAVDNAVGIVDPRTERGEVEAHAVGPAVGRIEMILHLHGDRLALVHAARTRGDRHPAFLEGDAIGLAGRLGTGASGLFLGLLLRELGRRRRRDDERDLRDIGTLGRLVEITLRGDEEDGAEIKAVLIRTERELHRLADLRRHRRLHGVKSAPAAVLLGMMHVTGEVLACGQGLLERDGHRGVAALLDRARHGDGAPAEVLRLRRVVDLAGDRLRLLLLHVAARGGLDLDAWQLGLLGDLVRVPLLGKEEARDQLLGAGIGLDVEVVLERLADFRQTRLLVLVESAVVAPRLDVVHVEADHLPLRQEVH